jgi:UDP-N-acetylmuramoyl-L-alanyl-D-glutamate--2,6-diaminopimelate ligase
MKVVGVTGTNGKTTIATLLYKLFTSLGYKSGLISTIENNIGNKTVAATHTTPDAVSLMLCLSRWLMRDARMCSWKQVHMHTSNIV